MSNADESARKQRVVGRPYQPGESGNPAGRPKGARSKFGEAFVTEFAEHWAQHGRQVLDHLVAEDRATYARVACAILPKVIELDEETKDALKGINAIPWDQIKTRAQTFDEERPVTH